MMEGADRIVWTPYCGVAPTPADYLGRWNLDPLLLAALGLLLAALVWRTDNGSRRLAIAAVAVLVIGFVSPLCALSSALFSARTVHHVLLAAVAAPLLAWALPRRAARSPALATLCMAAVFWSWQSPGLYAAALSNDAIYWTMQLTLLGSAVWFWMTVRAAGTLAGVAALLVAMVQMGLLGALITFAEAPLYAPHLLTTRPFGLDALDDQRIGGLIMWAPAAAIYLIAALAILGRGLGPGPASAARAP